MSQNPSQPPEKRRQIIKDHIATHINAEIAQLCGVTPRTIQRDIRKMKESGEWEEWLEATLLNLLRDGEISDTAKFSEIAKLYGKTLTTKSEAHVETRGTVNVAVDRGAEIEELLQRYDHLFETSRETGALQEDSPGELVHPPPADG